MGSFAWAGFSRWDMMVRDADPITHYVIDGSVQTEDDGVLATVQNQRAVVHMVSKEKGLVKSNFSRALTLRWVRSNGRWVIDGWRNAGVGFSDAIPE